MKNLKLGDVTISNSDDDGGFDILVNDKQTAHIYASGEIQLFKWLAEKYGRTVSPDIAPVDPSEITTPFTSDRNPPPTGEKETK